MAGQCLTGSLLSPTSAFFAKGFSNISTVRHVRAALLSQSCSGKSSLTTKDPDIPKTLECTFCGHELGTLELLHAHLEQHLASDLQ